MSPEDPAKTAVDPSMEDILASIRRILTEEDSTTDQPGGSALADADDDVLSLDEAMMVAPPQSPLPTPEMESNAVAPPLEPPTPPAAPPAAPEPVLAETSASPIALPAHPASLIAPEAEASATAALSGLVRSLQTERTTTIYGGGPTIEDLVRAEIRPILKSWLDTHLPGMVERVVRTEVERLAGRVSL